MSRFEHRLRQEMLELAQWLAPDDLRPLREPPPGRLRPPGRFEPSGLPARAGRDPARWLAPLAAMAAITLVAGGLLAVRNVLHARAVQDSSAVTHLDPGMIAVTGTSASGADGALEIVSARTGRVARSVSLGSDGNGLALAPDSKYVYVVGDNLWISQVSLASGKSRHVAAGVYPAVSPDSLTLAYASADDYTNVAVKDLTSGRTKSISLLPLMGADSSLLNQGGLTWLGNGTQVVAVPEPDPPAVRTGADSESVKPGKSDTSIKPLSASPSVTFRKTSTRRNACGQQSTPSGLCVIIIDVRAHSLKARKVIVPHVTNAGPLDVLSGDLTAKRSFVVAQPGRNSDVVERITLAGGTATARRLVTLPAEAFAVGIAPDADRVLYLPHSSPTSMWVATMTRGRLTHARQLLITTNRFEFDQVTW